MSKSTGTLEAFIAELEEAAQELADFAKYDDGFEQLDVAELVEELSRKAAMFGAPIESERSMLTPREGLIRVGRLLAWASRETDRDSKKLDDLLETVRRLETRQTVKEWYTVKEAAEMTDVAAWTIRHGCNTGRFNAKLVRKGQDGVWRLNHDLIESIRNHGLPPKPKG